LFDSLAEVRAENPGWSPQVLKLRTYFNHPGFVEAMVDATRTSLEGLPAGSRLVFTTHSIPTADADRCDYVAQHRDVAATIARALGHGDEWDLVYQSRSGAPHIPWLEPDIGDHLMALADAGVPGAVMVPIGFVSDHMEVIWDLDTIATEQAQEAGIAVARAATAGTDPRFIAMLADLLEESRATADGLSRVPSPTTGALGPRVVPCAAGCCPNPRGPRPALCGADS
jgi:ferrochelatase